ncbi:MAG: CPBP family intramembrane glutamic endopeptidase [Spirochaetales bacterium]
MTRELGGREPFPGALASLGLTVAVLLVFSFLDPGAKWPLGTSNLLAFGLVLAVGWAWQRRGSAPSSATPATVLANPLALALGVGLSAVGGSLVLGQVGNLVAQLWPIPETLVRALTRLFDPSQPVPLLVALMLVAPLTEESLFRGLMLPPLVRRYGSWAAVLWTSLLFGLMHLNPWQGVPAVFAGVYLGWLRLKTGGLAWPLAAHALFNGLPVVLALAGLVVAGYNTPVASVEPPLPALWLAGGLVSLAAGLVLTFGRLFHSPEIW